MQKVLSALKFVWKNNKVWLLISSIVMIIVFTATMIATQNVFLRSTINSVMGGERRVLVEGDPSKYQYFVADNKNFKEFESGLDFTGISAADAKKATKAEGNKLNEKIAEEGIVLLKNDGGALPLATSSSAKKKISVFGKNSVNLVYGGSGSGRGNSEGIRTLYESLEEANFDVNPVLKSFYENKSQSGGGRKDNPPMGDVPTGLFTGETIYANYPESVKTSYANYNDAALIVISRIGGEGFDLPRTMKKSFTDQSAIDGAASADDHYLQLDKREREMITAVCGANFGKVILIINCSTSMELGFLDDIIADPEPNDKGETRTYDNRKFDIDAALWIGSPGGSGIMALGRVLNGSVNPSGRLVDEYVRDFKYDPTWENFSNNNVEFGNRYTIAGDGINAYFVEYEESIYMGYRYYETRSYTEDDDWYAKNVVFPFGYGLSYTTFEWGITDLSIPDGSNLTAGGEIEITVRVTNTGTVPGKDVVQLYYNAPYYKGEIEKSYVVLGAFAKTEKIAAGAHDDVKLTMKVSDMASYDYSDANHNTFKGYELEDGWYNFFVSNNSHSWSGIETDLMVRYRVPRVNSAGFKYEKDPVTGEDVKNRFDDVSGHFQGEPAKGTLLSRSGFGSSLPYAPTAADRVVTEAFKESLVYNVDDAGKPWYTETMPVQGKKPAAGEKAAQLHQVIKPGEGGKFAVDYNDPVWDEILDQITVSDMAYFIGTGNFHTNYIENIGKPMTTDADGPAGFTIFMGDPTVYDTCFYAGECVIAATWNVNLAHDMGVMVGIEGIWGNARGDGRPYSGWYAPAVNLHRSPFSGRNFEYYSEDPHLTGMMGANVVIGAKSKGVYTYVKHFAVNDQETNRDTNGLITWLTEQTMRELYIKPFEIIVKAGKTTAIMSSFNRIGTVWAGGSYELCTEVLRNEWGFKGMVVTDYNLYTHMPVEQMIRAGGDLNLTQNSQPNIKDASATQVSLMRSALKNALYTIAGSNAMNGMGEGVVYRYALPIWTIMLIILNVALFVGFAVWGFFAIRRSLKKKKA